MELCGLKATVSTTKLTLPKKLNFKLMSYFLKSSSKFQTWKYSNSGTLSLIKI
jgi:hypothetical protein